MSIIAWIVLGLISGFIANKILEKAGPGLVFDLSLGTFGAVISGLVYSLSGRHGMMDFDLWSAVVSIIGATVVLAIHHAVSVRREAA